MSQTAVRSGTPFWRLSGLDPIPCPPLRDSIQCDVAVIGAGITGSLVADVLSREGMDVVVLDQGEVGLGSTAGSTGLLLYEVDVPLRELISKVGESAAVGAYREGLDAINRLEGLAGDLTISNDFARRSSLYLASSLKDVPDLREEFECRRYFGFDVEWLDEALLAEGWGLRAPAALLSKGDAEINPYRMTQGLMLKAIAQGARAYGETRVTKLQEGPTRVMLDIPEGEVSARAVVIATGYFARPFVAEDLVSLKTTYAAVGQSPVSKEVWSDRSVIWETARPYFYGRQTSDGLAMIGGQDTAFSDDHTDESQLIAKAELLSQHFQKLFPGATFTPDCIWGGTFAETKDGLPLIGRIPGYDHVYGALGYGGNGITFSTIAAGMIRDLILGVENESGAKYRFDR